MFKVELHNPGADGETVPCFATCTEIEVAEQLRQQLEKRLLGPSTPPPPLGALSSDTSEAAPSPDSGCRHKHNQP